MSYTLLFGVEKNCHAFVTVNFELKKTCRGKYQKYVVKFIAHHLMDNTVLITYYGVIMYHGKYEINDAKVFDFEWAKRAMFKIVLNTKKYADELKNENIGSNLTGGKIIYKKSSPLLKGAFNELFNKT